VLNHVEEMMSQEKRTIEVGEKATLRIRVSEKDVHYAGGLVNGAYVLGLFGDVGTEVLIRFDGDEGLLAAYNTIQLKSPVKAGDFLEVSGWVSKVGATSRTIQLEAHRYIKVTGTPFESSADYLVEPELVARAEMVSVVRKQQQRCGD
jgi:acyl-CoA hydrolase